MKPRILLALLALTLLLVGVGAWWMLESKSRHTQEMPSVESWSSASSVPARLDVAQSKPATASSREQIEPAAPSTAKAPHADLRGTPGNFSFVGRVTSAIDRTDIVGAYVHLEQIDGLDPLDPPIADFSDQSGEYAIYAVPVGNWKLVCSAQSFLPAEVSVWMPTSGGKHQQDIRLQPDAKMNLVLHLHAPGGGSLFDHLDAEDAALVDLLRPVFVDLCPARGSALPPGTSVITFQGRAVDHVHAVTDEWQRVQLRDARGGCCAVVLDDRVLDAAVFTGGMSDLTLVVSIDDLHRATGSLRLAIVDAATNEPLAGVRLSLRPAAGPTRALTTDADGRTEFALVMPGEAVCEIDAAGHALATKKVTIEAGKTADLGTIRLPATLIVSGTIDMPPSNSRRRDAVFVHAYRIADQEGRALETPIAVQPNGTFEFPRLYPGEYVIGWRRWDPPPAPALVRSGELIGWTYVDARAGSVRGVHIVVKPSMWDPQLGDGRASR